MDIPSFFKVYRFARRKSLIKKINCKTKMKYSLMVLLFPLPMALAQSFCPPAPNEVKPQLTVDVDFNEKTNLYTYSYTLKAEKGSKLPIDSLDLFLDKAPNKMVGPPHWVASKSDNESGNPGEMPVRVMWGTISNKIQAGKSLSGFKIISPIEPGIVRYTASGLPSQMPSAVPTETDDEPVPDCPNFHFNEPYKNSLLLGSTIGPAPAKQVSADILIPFKSKLKMSLPRINPLSSGRIQVLLLGSEDFDVKDVDIDSLEFGFGKAKPLRHQFIKKPQKKKVERFFKRKKHGKHDKRSHEPSYTHLLLQFDLDDVGVRCDLDHALFLTGKVGDQDLIAAAEIESTPCTHEMHKKHKERKEKWKKRRKPNKEKRRDKKDRDHHSDNHHKKGHDHHR